MLSDLVAKFVGDQKKTPSQVRRFQLSDSAQYVWMHPRIAREEFDAIAALTAQDPNFPKSHGQWIRLMKQSEAERRARGLVTQEIEIHPHEFSEWCRASRLHPDLYTLMAYAFTKARLRDKLP